MLVSRSQRSKRMHKPAALFMRKGKQHIHDTTWHSADIARPGSTEPAPTSIETCTTSYSRWKVSRTSSSTGTQHHPTPPRTGTTRAAHHPCPEQRQQPACASRTHGVVQGSQEPNMTLCCNVMQIPPDCANPAASLYPPGPSLRTCASPPATTVFQITLSATDHCSENRKPCSQLERS